MIARALIAALLLTGTALPVFAQETTPQEKPAQENPADAPASRPMRNAPAPRALELASYVFAASNVCGFKIGVPAFEALLAKQNVKPEDVSPRGPFGQRIQGIFALMSNDMALHREQSCLAVAGEYGPEGTVAKDVLLINVADEPPAEKKAPEAPPAK